jgi:hypothetical protein
MSDFIIDADTMWTGLIGPPLFRHIRDKGGDH